MKQIFCDASLLPFQERKGSDVEMYDVMSTERCAKLMVLGMANDLDEVWISENPVLLMVYFNQYLPNLSKWYVLLNEVVCFCDDNNSKLFYHLHGQTGDGVLKPRSL